MATLKLRAVGNSMGVILPKDILAQLDVQEGDSIEVINTPEGLLLTALRPAEAEQLRLGREIMRRYKTVMRELAK